MKGAAVNEQLNLGRCRWGEMASEHDTCWPGTLWVPGCVRRERVTRKGTKVAPRSLQEG